MLISSGVNNVMHVQKIISGIRELQEQLTENKIYEARKKKARQKKIDAMLEEKEKDDDFFIEKMKLKKEKKRLMDKKILEREKEREEDREEEIDKARLRNKMELLDKDKKVTKSIATLTLRTSRGVGTALAANADASRYSHLFCLLSSVICVLASFPCLLSSLSSPVTHSFPF